MSSTVDLIWRADKLTASERLVALFLATNANMRHESWRISYSEITWATGLSRSTVQRTIRSLLSSGLLALHEEANAAANVAATYRFDFSSVSWRDHAEDGAPPIVTMTTGGSHHDHSPVVTMTTGSAGVDDAAPYIEKQKEYTSQHEPTFERLRSEYNAHRGSLPECQSLNTARRSLMKRLLKDAGRSPAIELLKQATLTAAADSFYQERRYGIDTVLRHTHSLAERYQAMPRVAVGGSNGSVSVGGKVNTPYGEGVVVKIASGYADVRITKPLTEHADYYHEIVEVQTGDIHARAD